MADPKAPCTCNHPAAEHAEVEGLGLGHCKVPSCECGAFDPASGGPAPESGHPPEVEGARHVFIVRATDATGEVGVEIRAVGEGSADSIVEQVAETHDIGVAVSLVERARQMYREMTGGEEPVHSASSLLPFFADEDAPEEEDENGG